MTGDSCARSIAEVRDLVGALLTTSRHTRTAARQTVNMSVTIRTIEAEECPLWRNLRLRALADSPDAFRSTLDEESKIGQCRDLPLGSVDASIVATEERLDITQLATLDRRHFSVVRPVHTHTLELLP